MRVLLPVLALLLCLDVRAARPVEEVKTAYIFNFLKYVFWPNENEFEAFRIGFIGDDERYFEACLLLQTQSVRNKALVVHRIEDFNDIHGFQIIFPRNFNSIDDHSPCDIRKIKFLSVMCT